MHRVSSVLALVLAVFSFPAAARAQSTQDSTGVPGLITITGVFRPADGQPPATVETVTLSVYEDQEGGSPLWQETQTVTLDDRSRYSLLLGASQANGIPPAVFASGTARWLGTRFERRGESEGPRVRLTSVPYALKASDAETLGGRPASDYLLAPGTDTSASRASGTRDSSIAAPAGELPGTPGAVAKYVDASNVGPSAIVETGGLVGIGTSAPQDFLHVRYTNTNGGATGLAVQNLGNTATSYSGMLFYDQNGALGQFQGFNNVTHEYRINNIATAPTGSINFMIGSTSRFFVGSNGRIGIGTTAPSTNLDISNALTGTITTDVNLTTFGNNPEGSLIAGRRARGTPAAPAALHTGDSLAIFGGRGYGSTTFSTLAPGITIRASESWTDTARGTAIDFSTTPYGSTTIPTQMTLDSLGHLGVGTMTPDANLEVVSSGGINPDSNVVASSYGGEPRFLTQAARGLTSAPAAVQLGDAIGVFASGGYGTTEFGDPSGGLVVFAAENFTDAAHGAGAAIYATPLGAIDPSPILVALPSGHVAIGTPGDVNGIPTAADKLQVFGDIRVGTTGTNGCLKNFAGTGIAGTCSSDRRLKKDIVPFAPVLTQLTALQPVHYYWRTEDFPTRHFGNSRAYGLIAQDVEQVLPELVSTDSDGYKAIDYSKLQLLTIQAVKELKTENDALKQRVAELERLVTEMLAKQK